MSAEIDPARKLTLIRGAIRSKKREIQLWKGCIESALVEIESLEDMHEKVRSDNGGGSSGDIEED